MPAHKLPLRELVWTPEIAYAIGLMVTDGNLSKDGRHMTMRSKDIQLLQVFKKCLELHNPIVIDARGYYRIQFGGVQLYGWFLSLGITPAKSHTIGVIDVPDRYFQDFLRGHLDGDGSITVYTDRYNTFKDPKYVYTRLWLRFISASEKHIHWLREKISFLTGLKGHFTKSKVYSKIDNVSMSILKFGKKDSIKLLSWIYYHPDLPCLRRKQRIASRFLVSSTQSG